MKKINQFKTAAKSILFLLVLMSSMLFNSSAVKASAEKAPLKESIVSGVKNEQAKVLLNRLEEIKDIDKSQLSSSERKELRKEVREIKSQLREIGGGVYLSAGAIIIIILLLIILI